MKQVSEDPASSPSAAVQRRMQMRCNEIGYKIEEF